MTKKISSRRGRPVGFDRDAALETAQRLFQAHGYDGVGIARLSEELGIKPPSLYGAFGNKAALFETVLERYTSTTGRFMAQAFAAAPSVRCGVRDMLIAAARTYTEDADCAGCLIMEGAHQASDPAARNTCLGLHAQTRASISAYVAAEFPDTAETVADQIMIALAGMSAAARSGASQSDLEQFADMVAAALPYG